jgi:hypothetical protein
MKTFGAVVAAFALVLTTVGHGSAQCAFQHPGKAKKVSAALTQAFRPCGGVCFGGPLEGSFCAGDGNCMGGFCRVLIDGYNPVAPQVPSGVIGGANLKTCPATTFSEHQPNSWSWGPNASGSITFKLAKDKRPPSPLNPPGSMDWLGQLRMSGILDGSGMPATGPGGALHLMVRLTVDDGANGTTIQDFPVFVSVPVVNGKISQTISVNEQLNIFEIASLPPCSSIELLSVVVQDQHGDVFATIGGFLP